MENNLFDKFIKEKLHDSNAPVPEGLWEKVVAEKERKRPFGIFPKTIIVVAIAVVLITGGYLAYNAFNKNNNTAQNSSSNKKINTTNYNTAKADDRQNANNITAKADEHKPDNNNIAKAEEKQTQGNANATALNNNGVSVDKKPSTAIQKRFTTNPSPAKVSLQQNRQASHKSSQTTWSSNKNNNTANLFIYDLQTGETIANKGLQPNATNTLQQDAAKMKAIEGSKLTIANNVAMPKISNVNTGNKPFIDCPSSDLPRRNDFYVEAYAGPNYSFKNYDNQHMPEQFGSLKDSTETQRLGFTAGVRLSKTIGNNMLLKGGLQYAQINERFNLRSENERRITTVITIRQVVLSPGDTIFVSDTSSVTQIGYRIVSTTNTYRSIDLPILLSYEFGNAKLKYAITGGAIFNIRSWNSGNIIDTGYNAVSFDNKSNSVYKTHLGISLYAGFSVIKNISPKLDFFAEPYFRYSLRDMTRRSVGFKQTFNTAGVLFGLRYNLNRNKQ